MKRTVGIYLFDEVEVLDFAGPFEVFSTATRVRARVQPDAEPPFEVFTLADTRRIIKARGGLSIEPHFDIIKHPPLDILIIPGGVVTAELARATVIDWIARMAQSSMITASVCTGAFLLAKAGLLKNKKATTHWEDIAALQRMFPTVMVETGVRWVESGKIVTSAGISAGIDMSLHLVARLEGAELARQTAHQMAFER